MGKLTDKRYPSIKPAWDLALTIGVGGTHHFLQHGGDDPGVFLALFPALGTEPEIDGFNVGSWRDPAGICSQKTLDGDARAVEQDPDDVDENLAPFSKA